MSVDSRINQYMSNRKSQYSKDIRQYVSECMIYNDIDSNVLDLAKNMIFKSPQPKSMIDYIKNEMENIVEDVKKYSKYSVCYIIGKMLAE